MLFVFAPAFALGIFAHATAYFATAPDGKRWMRQVLALVGALFAALLAIAVWSTVDIRFAAILAAVSYYVGTQQIPLIKRVFGSEGSAI